MAVMSQEVQEVFNKVKTVVFGTADAQGQPNINIVAIKTVVDDETVYLSDQFFNKTLANLQVNDKVAITFFDDHDAYSIHGTATYINEGEDFQARKAWADAIFAQMGAPIQAKGGCYVHVDGVYFCGSGPKAGELLA